MNIFQHHMAHRGEHELQARRHAPANISEQLSRIIQADMPRQHADFFTGLPYLPLATLDAAGRPWVSLLITQAEGEPTVGINVSETNVLHVAAHTNPYDPFLRALDQTQATSPGSEPLFAGVGLDFSNRRRNKLGGTISDAGVDAHGKLNLTLRSDQHLGNCPKYITLRSLAYRKRSPHRVFDHFTDLNQALPEKFKTIVEQASTVFLATKHSLDAGSEHNDQADMGLNHRGGAPGFVRMYEEIEGDDTVSYLVIPDYSGNRFYQSLGNIQTNKHVGLVIPNFKNGDLLYLSGEAENIFDEHADALMPNTSLLTRIRISGVVCVEQGLDLELLADEQLSPYNPPIKYLRTELESMGRLMKSPCEPNTATLRTVKQLTSSVSTFTFELSCPVNLGTPGAFGIFDFSDLINLGYRHMDDINPQLLNEDYIRTWTISSAPHFNKETFQFDPTTELQVTVKRTPKGLISGFMHELSSSNEKESNNRLTPKFKGTGAGLSCFIKKPDASLGVHTRMLWVAGGVGVTPFMAMWDGLVGMFNSLAAEQIESTVDITLMFAGRDDDLLLLKHFLKTDNPLPATLNISIVAFQSPGQAHVLGEAAFQQLVDASVDADLNINKRKMVESDFNRISELHNREVFLCGPEALMGLASSALLSLDVEASRVHQESFFF